MADHTALLDLANPGLDHLGRDTNLIAQQLGQGDDDNRQALAPALRVAEGTSLLLVAIPTGNLPKRPPRSKKVRLLCHTACSRVNEV
jgi:hypothetical protein